MHPSAPRWFAAALLLAPCFAQQPAVGSAAPPIAADTWLNWDGEPPTLESLRGRVVMLEFWGTWCGPCVRAMPGIQKLHDRYRGRGLTVLAISYESTDKMRPFLSDNAYSMPVGSDPDKKTIAAYGVRGWPTTVVIDKQGNIAHVGSPYDAEAAVEKALGLESGSGSLLTAWCEAQKAGKDDQRQALERLAERGAADFELAGWARGHLPAETVADGSAAAPAAKVVAPANAGDVLRRCIAGWHGDAKARQQLLQQLAAVEMPFDLAAFAQQAMAKAFPFEPKELQALLQAKDYAAVVDAIGQRAPAAAVLQAAAKDQGLQSYCSSKVEAARRLARKGLMAQHWMFANALPRDEALNRRFQSDLAMSGIALSDDKKSIVGVLLGGEMIKKTEADAFIDRQLTLVLVMGGLAEGKPPRVDALGKQRAEAKQRLLDELEQQYGKPEPFEKK